MHSVNSSPQRSPQVRILRSYGVRREAGDAYPSHCLYHIQLIRSLSIHLLTMATIADLIAKPSLPLGRNNLRLIKATLDPSNGRIALLFGSNEYEGLASESVMPSELNWVLPIWMQKMGDSISIDTTTDFASDEEMRQSIVASLNDAKGEFFDVVVSEANVEPLNGNKLFNCSFA